MITLRGNTYHFDAVLGGVRKRASLSVSDPKAANRLANRIQFALADGPRSVVWSELKTSLSKSSYKILTEGLGLPEEGPNLKQFEQMFLDEIARRRLLGRIVESTRENYAKASKVFFDRMIDLGVQKMDEIDSDTVSEYITFRRLQILEKSPDKGARGLESETRILKMVLDLAFDRKLISKRPLKETYRSDVPAEDPNPFTTEEIDRLTEAATGEYRLPFLLLLFTGLRKSDASDLTWSAVDLNKGTIKWTTRKRKTVVQIPLNPKLKEALIEVRGTAEDTVLGISETKLYSLIKELGVKAGVADCHPHKFRTTLACTMLASGASMFDVARLLGDSHATIDRYYAQITDGQQDRVRKILEK